jgi:type I restriction enzyme S subunit
MAVFSIVKLSELEGAKRIDAEYYKPEYLKVKQKLLQTEFVCFKDLVKEIIHPKEIKREYEEEKQDYLFLLAQNVRPLMLDLSEKKYISEERAKLMPKNLLEKGDILFVRSGNVGDLTIYTGEPNKAIASADLLVAKPTFSFPYYLGVFLSTTFGQKILLRGIYSGLQPHIAPGYIKTIPVPIFSKKLMRETEKLFLKSQDFLKESQNLYSQAENLLLEELGLKDLKPKYEKTYTAKLSDAFSAHRIDAEYFQPAYEEVIRKIEGITELKPLGKLANRVKLKVNPENNKLYRYIEISDVLIDIGEVNYTERLGRDLPPNARIPVKGGELIISKVRPTRGAIGIIPYCSGENLICSSAFSVFNVNSPLKEYLYVTTRSIIGRLQLEKPTKGTSYPTIEDLDVERLQIPLLPLETQQKIASLVQQSHEARKKAKELLEVAKRAVEIAIENNEREALDYISKVEVK